MVYFLVTSVTCLDNVPLRTSCARTTFGGYLATRCAGELGGLLVRFQLHHG